MKAMVYLKYGPPEVLQLREVSKPVPKDNEILVKIYASSVSSGDSRMRRADPFAARLFNGLTRPKKVTILGNEFSGVVEAIGENVKLFVPGDPVYGQNGLVMSTNAEYITIAENGPVAIKPANLSWEEAAVIPFGASTALEFLKMGNISSGKKVLIYGASGSLGTAAVQLARYFGAQVTGICSTRNIKLVESLGAHKVFDYTLDDFSKNGQQYDIIFDTVGKSPFNKCLKALKPTGFYLRAVHISLSPIIKGLWTNMTSKKKIVGGIVKESKENLDFLRELIETGKLKPIIDRSYPLERLAEAHSYVDKGHKIGNVAITIS